MSSDPFATVVPFQIPEQFRAFAENGVSQAREGYQKFKEVAEANNEAIEAACNSAAKGAGDFTSKLIDIAKADTTMALDFAQALLGVKSLPEVFDLVNAQTHKQFEAFSTQAKDLAEIGQKVAADTVEPFRASTAKVFKSVA